MNDVPDIILERYRLGELPPDAARDLEARIPLDEALRRRLDALDASDRAIRQSGALANLRPLGRTDGGRRTSWVGAAVLVAAAVVLALVVAPRSLAPDSDRVEGVDRGDRLKGLQPALTVYRQTPRGSESLADGALARRGDLLRLGYRAAGQSYGVIFSIDGRGSVTRHLPPSGDRAATLKREPTLLDQSYELDDAPLWERFYFITGDRPFGVAEAVDAVRRAAALPKGLAQSTFVLQKEATP